MVQRLNSGDVQIRHRLWGLYQGLSPQGYLWYPLCETPTEGIRRLSRSDALSLIRTWLGYAKRNLGSFAGAREDDFTIEPYSETTNHILRMQHTSLFHYDDLVEC